MKSTLRVWRTRKRKFVLSTVLSLMLIGMGTATATVHGASAFSDVGKAPWAEQEILFLYEQNVVSGLPDGSFGLYKNIKRADAAIMLVRAKGLDIGSDANHVQFSDVDKHTYYYEAVQAAVEAGYLNGLPDGRFQPNKPLTRAEMAKIIAVAFDYEYSVVDGFIFKDSAESWAKEYIDAIAVNGITNGQGDGNFQPGAHISRVEFAVMLARAMNDSFKLEAKKLIIETPETKDLTDMINGLRSRQQEEYFETEEINADSLSLALGYLLPIYD